MKIKLAYGRNGLTVNLPDNTEVIEPIEIPALKDENAEAARALRQPIGSMPLKDMVSAHDRVCIVISDITRPTPNHKLVPWIMNELAHVPDENFVIINGTGSHRDNTGEELVSMLGSDIVDRIRIINNNAQDTKTQAYLGRTKGGAEVYLNREYVESDFRIVTGFIEPHFFAGFSGGPKGIMPGIAGIDTIMHFHNASMIGHPDSTWGVIDGNPVQEEATEIALMCRPHFLFNVALNGNKEITQFFAGDLIEAHRKGCEYVREHAMVRCSRPYDIVITSNSGYPLDQNLYQAVKGMSAAHRIVKKGGAIICAAECCDGLPNHGNYAKILKMGRSPGQLLEIIQDPGFKMFDQWQVQKQAIIQTWAEVYVYSSIPESVLEQAMFKKTDNMEQTLDKLLAVYGKDASIAVMPLGPLTIPYIG